MNLKKSEILNMSFFNKLFNKKKEIKKDLKIKDTDSIGDMAIKLAKAGVISIPKDNNHNSFGQELDKLIDGELPFGWEHAKQDFIKPRDNKLFDLSIRASKTDNIDVEIKLLEEFIAFFKEYENECKAMGECYEKYFIDMHIKNLDKPNYSWLNERKERLKYLEENKDKLIAEKQIKDVCLKDLIQKLENIIVNNQGILQSEIYKQFNEIMKDEISSQLYYWAKEGKIRREKSGKTYKIYYNN